MFKVFTFLSLAVSFISSSLSSSVSSYSEPSLFIDRFSYCKSNDIQSFTCENCSGKSLIGVYDPISKASSQVVVVLDKEEEEILVGFRGTINKIQQWVSDMDAVYTKWSTGKVHSGFYKRFNEIKEPTLVLLKKARKMSPDAAIIVSGHSMGGAVATLFSSYLNEKEKKYTPQFVYTYGSPRVGDRVFSKYVDEQFGGNLVRIMNEWDMVTDLPPAGFGYRHTGKLVVCKTGTTDCLEKSRLDENPGGLIMALKRTIKSAENIDLCHLTYLDETIGTNRYKCL